ncbi:MAG TPA: SMI1/KNR4 family protein [Candidatus Sulfotelmatobacter sp.]|nr:SMI1/KNR4 family protein [Candidatus Sulfotelmatobacter sp.]
MNESDWKIFLAEYNRELLSYEEVVEILPKEIINAGWLRYSGASEDKIEATETRLAIRLPPAYRAFLKASNGWRFSSISISDLWPAQKLTWFREHNQDWIDAYVGSSEELPPLSDKEYFVYGAKQDCVRFRPEYLETALQIAEVRDSAVILLNPKVVTAEGEWETWLFANWLPGAVRYRTFADWFTEERKQCRKNLKPIPKATVAKCVTARKPVSVKKAQAAARGGQTQLVVDSLEGFAAKGDNSAAASLAELRAFLGQWKEVIINAGRLIANPTAVYADNVFQDMIRLLGRAGHRSGDWARVIEVAEAASQANASRFCELSRQAKDKVGRNHLVKAASRYERIFRNLIGYAERNGKPPHELIAIFGIRTWRDDMDAQKLRAWYEEAVKNAEVLRPDLKRNPLAKWEHFFSLAQGVAEDEALKLYEAHGQNFEMRWQAAEYVAPIYVRLRNESAAWAAIAANLKHWWPVDNAQVTPLALLTNEHLETIMTPERCALVLSTPRGPEGAKAGGAR